MLADQALQDFLTKARRTASQRMLATSSFDTGLVTMTIVMAGIHATRVSLRGDLVAPLFGFAWLVALILIWLPTVRRHLEFARDPLAIARLVARPDPRRPSDPDQQVLRQEIVGAAELSTRDWHAHGRHGHRGSVPLSSRYCRDVGAWAQSIPRERAVPSAAWRLRARGGLAALLIAGASTMTPGLIDAAAMLSRAQDGRPLPDPGPLWQSLELELEFPAHVVRESRTISNLSGQLRAPAGTKVTTRFAIPDHFFVPVLVIQPLSEELEPVDEATRIDLLQLDRSGSSPSKSSAPERGRAWESTFELDGIVQWHLELRGGPGRDRSHRHTSEPVTIEIEIDELPEVEISSASADSSRVRTHDEVDIQIRARDDFGLGAAELVYQFADGEEARLPIGEARGTGTLEWQHEYQWQLEEIPIGRRRELIYWVEIRDNDPGLTRDGRFNPVGKVGKSAVARLEIHDDEASHAENIQRIARIRDAAVDLLASRLTTKAFELPAEQKDQRLLFNLRRVRLIHRMSEELLYMLVDAIEHVIDDPLTRQRDASILEEIHARLVDLHREASNLLARVPTGREEDLLYRDPASIIDVLQQGGDNNQRQIVQLEDELIRLDDLVDSQLVVQLEALVARLQASQQRLVDLLEQLAAGDESVRPRVEQLERRIQEDMRRVTQARRQLSKEVGHDFVNEDAYRAMEARLRHQSASKKLAQGDVDGALQQARDSLDQIRELRDEVQDRAGEGGEDDSRLSPEARARMKLLRELSRLEDAERGIESATRELDAAWRAKIGDETLPSARERQLREFVRDAQKASEAINDARLGRDAREGLADLNDALKRLARRSGDETSNSLNAFEELRAMERGSKKAVAGSVEQEREGQALRKLERKIRRMRTRIQSSLPAPDKVLDRSQHAAMDELSDRQGALRNQGQTILDDDATEFMPAPGVEALQRANEDMGVAGHELDGHGLIPSLDAEASALDQIQKAIASLRESNPPPPPPPPSAGGDSSTAAEQDRSLREQVIEAMRERHQDRIDDSVESYYEELLR